MKNPQLSKDETSHDFTLTFTPQVYGVYYINSPRLHGGHSVRIFVKE